MQVIVNKEIILLLNGHKLRSILRLTNKTKDEKTSEYASLNLQFDLSPCKKYNIQLKQFLFLRSASIVNHDFFILIHVIY